MATTFKSIVAIVLALSLSACAGAQVTKSDFDGSTQISSDYGWCENGVKMILSWNSKMPKDTIRLDAYTTAGYIAEGNSLHFNIDGHIIDLTSSGHPRPALGGMIVETYLVNPITIDAILQAQKAIYRIDLSKDYIEGSILDVPTGAISNFREFMTAFRQQTGTVGI